jgi:cyclophilin family peptidyl-prolyl cis-trans isomerase
MSIAQNFGNIKPSLNLDFANTKKLDSRITFTRASTATYYDGVTTAKAEENLLLQSQDFTTTWANTGTTDSANTEIAPDGTTTADTLTALNDASSGSTRIEQTGVNFISGQNYVFSLFVKNGTVDYLQLFFATATHGATAYANFDLTGAGVLGTVGAAATATITASTNGFYRLTITAPCTAGGSNGVFVQMIASASDARAASITRSGQTVFLWGAQLEQRSSVTSYTATTTQPITNYIPVLLTAANNAPRFDHNPTTAESLGLLIEESRTNLLTYSADFADAAWVKTRSSITSNTIVAPDGALTGDKFVEDTTATSSHFLHEAASVVSGTQYTYSFYAKAGERTSVRIEFSTINSAFASSIATFDLSAGTVTNTSCDSASITAVGNGWYRCTATETATASASSNIRLFLFVGVSAIYTGDGYSGIYIWGAQLEAGAFPTSYIATGAATATRSADAASMIGPNFSSWYNQSEGTIYSDVVLRNTPATATQMLCAISNGTVNERIHTATGAGGGGNINTVVSAGGVAQAQTTIGSLATAGGYRCANAYQVNSFATVVNGSAPATDTAGTLPVVNRLFFGVNAAGDAGFLNGTIKRISYYTLRLTNAQLQALTG